MPRAHRDSVYGIDFISGRIDSAEIEGFPANPDGIFASGSKDGTIALWDVFADSVKADNVAATDVGNGSA